jgi:hypothetical protein
MRFAPSHHRSCFGSVARHCERKRSHPWPHPQEDGSLRGVRSRAQTRGVCRRRLRLRYESAFSRRECARACINLSTLHKKGVGNAGCLAHPQPRMQNKKAYELVTTGSPDSPGIPARNGFNGFLRALPGDRACCHRRLRDETQT